MRKLQESTNPRLISFDWELIQVCPANSSNEYIDRSKILMTTACIHVYNLASRSGDIGLRFCTPFICRRFASGRQGRRCDFVSVESSLREPDPEFHIGPLGSIEKPPIGKCGPYAGPERVDPVVSTTVVNLEIFYLAVNYNVE